MHRQKRIPKDDDKENIIKASNLISELMEKNAQIEDALWIDTFITIVTYAYYYYGFSYEEFLQEMNVIFSGYEKKWNTSAPKEKDE